MKDFSLSKSITIKNQRNLLDKVDGVGVYTDSEIKKSFLNQLDFSNSYLNHPNIKKLIEKNYIVPIKTKKTIINKLSSLFTKNAIDNTLGFYDIRTNKIYIFISDNDNAFKGSMEPLILHELQHFCARVAPNNFYRLHKEKIINWWTEFGKEIVGNEKYLNIENIPKFCENMFFNSEISRNMSWKDFVGFLDNIITNKNLVNDIAAFPYFYYMDYSKFISLYNTHPMGRKIERCADNAYRKVFGITTLNSIVVQEFMMPSEIIAIEATYTKPKKRHFILIEKIK